MVPRFPLPHFQSTHPKQGFGQKNKEIWRNFFVKNEFLDILGGSIATSTFPLGTPMIN